MKKFSAISRVLAFLLVVCLCSAFVPVMTFAADVTPGTITITPTEGETVTLEEGKTTATIGEGSATYDVANNKITLNALNVAKIVFAMNGNFTVELIDENVIDSTALEDPSGAFTVSSGTATVNGAGSLSLKASKHAIEVAGNITLCSSVNLETTTDKGTNITGTLTISGATVEGRVSVSAGINASSAIVIENGATVSVYAVTGRALNAQAVTIKDSTVNTYVEDGETKLFSKYGITATTKDLTITNSTIDATVTNNSALYKAGSGGDFGIKITDSTIDAEGEGNLLRSDSNITIVNSDVDVTGTNGGTIINATMAVKIQGSDVTSIATASDKEKAIYGKTGIEIDDSIVYAETYKNTILSDADITIKNGSKVTAKATGYQVALRAAAKLSIDNSYVDTNSAGNTLYAKDLVISGDIYDAKTEKGTYVTSYGREYAIYATNSMTINGGTINAKSVLNAANYGVFGGYNFVQNGGDITVTVENDNPAFDLRGGNFTLAGGSFEIKGKAGPAFYLRSANTGLVLNGGSLTGTAGSLMNQKSVDNANTITVSPYAGVDMTFSSAAFTGANITVNDEGVTWEEGKELTATSGAAKTVPITTVDVPLSATVTLNGKAQADQTVAIMNGDTQLGTATSDENGAVSFTATLPVANAYTLTLKQVATNSNGYVYDLEGKNFSVVVKADGTYTVNGEAAFVNTYRYITITTETETKNLVDDEGDNAASPLEIGGGTITYDADKAIVTLNNVTAKSIVFNLYKDFTLEVVEKNEIKNDSGNRVLRIYNGNITVTGEGILNLSSANYTIHVDNGSWIQNGATVESHAVNGNGLMYVYQDVVINNGTLTGSSTGTNGIKADKGNIEIYNGVVNVSAGANGITANTNLIIAGGTVTSTVTKDYALRANTLLTISGGTVTVQAIPPTGYAVIGDGSATITIGPKAKLIAINNGGEGTISNGKSTVYDGVKFVSGMSFENNSGRVETLIEGEKDYNLPGEGTIIVNVTLNGEADENREVQLWQGETLLDTQTASAEGKVFFKINPVGEGEHTYTVKVVGENGNGYTFAEAQTVTVTVNSEGLATSEPVALANTFVAPLVDVVIGGHVLLTGRDVTDADQVTIQLLDADKNVLQTKTGAYNSDILFDAIALEYGEPTRNYTYYVRQVAPAETKGITYDIAEYEVTVYVAADGANQPVATITNTYEAGPADVTFEANVTLTGRDMVDGEFVLLIGEDEVPVEGGKLTWTSMYTTAGVYTVTVAQKDTGLKGVTYDLTEKTITVTVTDNGEGQLVASVEGNNVTFANTYAAAPITIDVDLLQVNLINKPLTEGDFTFVLMKGEEVISTATNSADGTIVFKDIEFTEKGEIELTAKQIIGDVAGITYDETVIVLTVFVEDWGEGALDVCGIDCTVRVFTNTYRVPFVKGEIKDGKYYVNNVPTEMGLIKIDGDYYYAGPNGVLVTDQDYYAWLLNEECDKPKGWYTFDKDGKMVISGLYNGRYYVDAIPTEVGLFLNAEDGKYYCAGPNGKIVKDADYYVWMIDASAKETFSYNWYRFDETGALCQGIYNGYYYVNGKTADVGLFELDGKYYFANAGGKIVAAGEPNEYGTSGSYYVWKTEPGLEYLKGWRYFDENGVMRAPRYGVHRDDDGYLYYFEDDKKKDIGLFYNEADGNFYCANSGGKLVAEGVQNEYGTSGSYYVWKIHESAKDMKPGWYEFDAEGKLID